MDAIRQAIFVAINSERDYQLEKWGTKFDDSHTPADWWAFVSLYFAKALQSWKLNPADPFAVNRPVLRRGLVKVSAILVAWIETLDRAESV